MQQYTYRPVDHYKQLVDCIGGTERTVIPHEVIEAVKTQTQVDDRSKLDIHDIIRALCQTGNQRYRDHAVKILVAVGGRPPPTISPDDKRRLVDYFNRIFITDTHTDFKAAVYAAVLETFKNDTEKLRLLEYIHINF